MDDLKKAREILDASDFSLVLVKGKAVLFSSSEKGITGLLRATFLCGQELAGASLADRIVGRAAALLALYCGISAVHARLLSEEGESLLKSSGILLSHDRKVPLILNRAGTGPCPLEEKSRAFESPQQAFKELSNQFSTAFSEGTHAERKHPSR